MANMSHCRFRNTVDDLDDCVREIETRLECAVVDEPLSDSERVAARRLVRLALELAGIVQETLDLTAESLLEDRDPVDSASDFIATMEGGKHP